MKGNKVRQLSAVMFTDIVGYTSLMQKDEALASQARSKHREIFEELHTTHQGKIIQYYGDGTLSVFKSAVEAVRCAIEIQRRLQIGNKVPLKIGIHLGDIVFDHTEVYGDGVNFASRIESMCTAGSILLSAKVNDELNNHSDITTVSLGLYELKNITRPVEVFAISNEGIKVPEISEVIGKQQPINKTIAVLPFQNFSGNENEYFSDGITEEIINALAKIKSIKVTSRTSSFFFKGKNISVKEIGKQLGVSTLIEGSIRVAGDTIRITAQLIQAEEDFHFWSETWDRKLANIFEIQDEISLIIADKLREQFGHFEIQEKLVEKQTESLDAYEHSLKANYYKNKWNPEDIRTAISHYENALEIDSNHVESHIGLSDAYSFLATTGFMPFDEAWEKAMHYTNRALSLNEQHSGIHYILSNYAFFVACDYEKSLQEMKKAIELNPNNAEAQQYLSFLYIIAGDKIKSEKHLDIALSINPLSDETQFFRAYHTYMVGDYKEALHKLDKCLDNNDKNIPAHSIKTLCLLKLGQYEQVISYFDHIPPEVIIEGEKTGTIGLAYALSNQEDGATHYLNKLIEQSKNPQGFTEDSYLFLMYIAMGSYDLAFEWVEQAIDKKSSLLLIRFSDPLADPLKNDPKYQMFHRKIFGTEKQENHTDKKKSPLAENKIDEFTARLLDHIRAQKPYLDTDLSLRSLADQVDIHPNQLSWLLNEKLGKNFNEFVNHFRVENFKSLATDPKKSHITIMGLAYESGFNSKTVFNTYFKKETSLTPRQFLNISKRS